ncbi:hypothetical protein AK830_g7235 [Neonectria ditissima]|uniref:Uncharacterized protein n=1 Tax=Neonectria ditissima TaxID=78410 RepID=A0A0N8H6L7_9HYPO|nr:hypothetical protein AK830_g7235 [Neonectria ditissima]
MPLVGVPLVPFLRLSTPPLVTCQLRSSGAIALTTLLCHQTSSLTNLILRIDLEDAIAAATAAAVRAAAALPWATRTPERPSHKTCCNTVLPPPVNRQPPTAHRPTSRNSPPQPAFHFPLPGVWMEPAAPGDWACCDRAPNNRQPSSCGCPALPDEIAV